MAVIPHRQMEEFIYLYESMPYNIELMARLVPEGLRRAAEEQPVHERYDGAVGRGVVHRCANDEAVGFGELFSKPVHAVVNDTAPQP